MLEEKFSFQLMIVCLFYSSYSFGGELYLKPTFEHISNPTINERGYGLNALFIVLEYQDKACSVSGALGLHDETVDCPEVCYGGNMLARFTISYRIKLGEY